MTERCNPRTAAIRMAALMLGVGGMLLGIAVSLLVLTG